MTAMATATRMVGVSVAVLLFAMHGTGCAREQRHVELGFGDPDHATRAQDNPRAYAPRPESLLSKSWDGNVHVDCVDDGMVALTFDDGPGDGTERVLDFLKEHDIRATFFVLGSKVGGQGWLLRRMVAEGHVVGSHSWDHPSFVHLSDADIGWQLGATERAVGRAARRRPRLFRPPYGEVDWRVANVVRSAGYDLVNWNVDSNDWQGDAGAAASNIQGAIAGWKRLKSAAGEEAELGRGRGRGRDRGRREGKRRGGYIVLQHDSYFEEWVGEATIKAAKRRGLRFVTMDECLGVQPYRDDDKIKRDASATRAATPTPTPTRNTGGTSSTQSRGSSTTTSDADVTITKTVTVTAR